MADNRITKTNQSQQIRLNDQNAQQQGPGIRDLVQQLQKLGLLNPTDPNDPNGQGKAGGCKSCSGGGKGGGSAGSAGGAAGGSSNPLMEALLEAQKKKELEQVMKQMRNFSPQQIAGAFRNNPGLAQAMGNQMGLDLGGGMDAGGGMAAG